MPERSDLTARAERQQGNASGNGASDPSPPAENVPLPTSDDAPTIISKVLPRPARADEALNSLRGRRLAHFELQEAIGVGGMAAVLKARDTQLDRTVALKILPPEMATEPENIQRFHQEARSAAKLDHENIARVFFCGEDQRLHFIAFEFVEGDNLRVILERRGQLPVGLALHYMLQIASGLAHAAARGVVHRDIKPSNIIITPTGRAKLVDMGLARSLERQDNKGLTHSGVTLGTFDYISPEQALEPRDADVRSDIYSLGCTFYHMITGRPPVPEGTAAKKLQHHQQVKPADPRELAPNIPDEVAMILARMMAKNPRDRYQTPEQLVQDLLRAARKYGASGDAPEGVLAVEASLPPRSAYRPMLVVAAAAAAVVALVLVLGPSVSTPVVGKRRQAEVKNHNTDKSPTSSADAGPKEIKDKSPPLEKEQSRPAVYDAEDVTPKKLAIWLQAQKPDAEQIEIHLARDLDLQAGMDDSDRGLLVKAKKVVIRSKDTKRRPTIRFGSAFSKQPGRAAITIDSKDVVVEGIRLVLDGSVSHEAMIGLLFLGAGRYSVERCDFIQARPVQLFDEQQRLASIVLDTSQNGANGARYLAVKECVFLGFDQLETEFKGGTVDLLLKDAGKGGQDAIVRRGSGHVDISQCAIGPHAAALRFEGSSGLQDSAHLTHCTMLAGRGSTAFCFHDDAMSRLEVRCSLFALSGEAMESVSDKDGACLIRQSGGRSSVNYQGIDNRYYNLDVFWVGDMHEETTYANFRRRLDESSGKDKDSRVLSLPPWQANVPLKPLELRYFVQFGSGKPVQEDLLQKHLEDELIRSLFQVSVKQSELRCPAGSATGLIGVEHVGGILFADKLPILEVKKDIVARRTLIVDPKVDKMNASTGTFRFLSQAVEEAQPGDVILIRHTGEVKVRPIQLSEPGTDLTIRAEGDNRPILVPRTEDRDASMFRLIDGTLRLEGLEFQLKPVDKYRSQTVVTIVGDGQCIFKDCVTTLAPDGPETSLAMATLADNADVMKMKTQPPLVTQSPRLSFDNCFVRGKGDLIASRVSRPFDLELRNSLLALDGNVLGVEVGETAVMAPQTTNVNLSVNHTTAYISGHFLRLRTMKDFKSLVPFQSRVSQSLFTTASGQAFIHLDGPEMSEDRLKEKLLWSGDQNVYGGYADMVAQQPIGEEPRPPAMLKNRWKTLAGEETSLFTNVKFTMPPGETHFSQMIPSMFKPADLTGVGVDLQQLPRPSIEP